MAKLSDEEQAQLEALQAKADAPDEPEGFGDGVIVLTGTRADSFLSQLGFGGGGGASTKTPPAKKAAPAKKTARNAASRPADTDGDEDQDDEDDDPGQQDDAPEERKHRYFR